MTDLLSNHDQRPAIPVPRSTEAVSSLGRAAEAESGAANALRPIWRVVKLILTPVASLKLTVVLFAMSIFLIYVGTIAQQDLDMHDVLKRYFRTWVAMVDFNDPFPRSFFPGIPDLHLRIPLGEMPLVIDSFPFPGGITLGLLLIANLLAAHVVRFTVQARGLRLVSGLIVTLLGFLVTAGVVASGMSRTGFQHKTLLDYDTIWALFKIGLGALDVATLAGFFLVERKQTLQRWSILGVALILAAILAWLLLMGEKVQLDDSYMRILWLLMKGTFAGLVLLAGCVLLFGKRAGVVLLHLGVLILMAGEAWVGLTAVEGQMSIVEGQTVNYVQHIHLYEIVVIDPSHPEHDDVVAVPQRHFLPAPGAAEGPRVSHALLPFDFQVVRYYKNSTPVRRLNPNERPLATEGVGTTATVDEARPTSGTDTDGRVNLPTVWIRVFYKGAPTARATYMLSMQLATADEIKLGDKTYQVALRFQRTYKPYSVELKDVSKKDYVGTAKPRDYRSKVHLRDPRNQLDEEHQIWMNNPMRYAGETFYQSSYGIDPRSGKEYTVLQVVTNDSWVMPYVACTVVGVGMAFHFLITLWRFLMRLGGDAQRFRLETPRPEVQRDPLDRFISILGWILTGSVLLIVGGFLLSRLWVPSVPADQPDLYRFGKLPVAHDGRIKPFDTLARNTLRIISDRETFTELKGNEPEGAPAQGATQPAIRWLLDVISQRADASGQGLLADSHQVIRIDHPELLEKLGLKRRANLRYSINELREKLALLDEMTRNARETRQEKRTTLQRRVLELERRLQHYISVSRPFQAYNLPDIPKGEAFRNDPVAQKQVQRIAQVLRKQAAELRAIEHPTLPLAVPISQPDEKFQQLPWETYAIGAAWQACHEQLGLPDNPAADHWTRILEAYRLKNNTAFNKAVADYEAYLLARSAHEYSTTRNRVESLFNHAAPFWWTSFLYCGPIVLTFLGWLLAIVRADAPFHRCAFWLTVLTLLAHTAALAARIYISGRPPITNLYSSAIFIGWGGVIFGLAVEWVMNHALGRKLGVGNLIAGVFGFSTLLIAHNLAADGDTFAVLQAVLDTQFWLATHVVCIALGYVATYAAGLLAMIYIPMALCTPLVVPKINRVLTTMIYGILCFAILFSFIGTVLGGLWADDSWGRFWGWDPKENGALIIVIWNALVLHARWDGMVKDRGLAVLSVGGMITTTWSWFGVNELGIGLHSYGFTEGTIGVLRLCVAGFLLFIIAGSLPREWWWSFRKNERTGQSPLPVGAS